MIIFLSPTALVVYLFIDASDILEKGYTFFMRKGNSLDAFLRENYQSPNGSKSLKMLFEQCTRYTTIVGDTANMRVL